MIKVKYFLVIYSCFLVGCSITGIKPDYIEPGGQQAKIKFNATKLDKSRMAYVHGNNVCSIDDASLVGSMNNKIIGLKSISGIEIGIDVGEVVISSPSAYVVGRHGSYNIVQSCQPLISFRAEENEIYSVTFAGCRVLSLVDKANENVEYKEIESCGKTRKTQSNKKPFFLKDPA